MKARIIVCGLDQTGYKIFSLLRQQGASVIGIHHQPIAGEDGNMIVGDLRSASTLLKAGIIEASTLVIAANDDALNLAILVQARVLNPQIRIINHLTNASLGDRLDWTLPDHTTLSVQSLAAPLFAFAALGDRAIGQLRLFDQTWPIYEEYIDHTHPWQGRRLSELWDDRSRMLIYYLPNDQNTDLISALMREQSLKAGDRLIFATQPTVKNHRRSPLEIFQKITSNLYHFHQQTQTSMVLFVMLLGLIAIATFTYTSVNNHVSFIDSLYFSVGLITGAGGNEHVVEQAPNEIKLFTVLTMLLGAAVIGITYALLTDWVLGTRFGQLWEITPIPKKNHYIVCGLGGIGVQIIKQLKAQGYEVIAIEQDPNCRFLNTAKSLKVPVIQGDASVASTLDSAKVKQAEALLAVTSNDIVNLEIALSVKGLAPRLPVIVRNTDPRFAQLCQQVFEFEAVLSPIELAAPSFAAAALGGKILGNGMTADSLWVSLATLITVSHPFCGRKIKEAAMSSDFVPLYVETNNQTIHGWDLLEIALSAGDILYLTMPANRLDQLWRNSSSQLMAS